MEFDQLSEATRIKLAADGIRNRGMNAETVETRERALERVVSLIPAGATVMTGASVTLDQIGFIDLLVSGNHSWKNLKDEIFAEKDPVRQLELRRRSSMADYFLGSVHAITEAGEMIIASASGSQLPAYAFCAKNIIWVAGTHKIVTDLDAGFRRVREYVFPLEDKRMKSTGAAGSAINKILIIHGEPAYSGRMVTMILVNDKLGF